MNDVFPFFTGCHRSGTTLIRLIFNAHSKLAIPRESHFISWLGENRHRYEGGAGFDVERFLTDLSGHERFQKWPVSANELRAELAASPAGHVPEAIRRLYEVAARKRDKPLYGDKTPRYSRSIPLLAEMFPESRFVHVIRDGRDVALSLLEMEWGPTKMKKAAVFWRERVEAAQSAGADLGGQRYLEYKHEDLIDDTPTVVKGICTFLGLEFEDDMLRYHEQEDASKRRSHEKNLAKPPTRGLRDWRTQMSPEDVETFESIAGDLLERLGYERATKVRIKRRLRA